eukprot:5751699-Pyramimonas_sp.AAC.1
MCIRDSATTAPPEMTPVFRLLGTSPRGYCPSFGRAHPLLRAFCLGVGCHRHHADVDAPLQLGVSNRSPRRRGETWWARLQNFRQPRWSSKYSLIWCEACSPLAFLDCRVDRVHQL